MAEQESEHRRKNEEKIVHHSIKKSGRGQVFAFILAVLSLGTIVPAIIALSSLIAVFAGKKQG
jgi:uncharacterized membrane protein